MPAELIPLASVVVGERQRKDLGDLEALVASIDDLGLLQPIGVTSDCELLFGRRRLEACRQLDWEEIPVVVLPDLGTAVDRLKAERDENVCRKEMTLSERVAIGMRLEEIEQPKAQARSQAGKTPASRDAEVGKTDKLVAGALGMKEANYRRAKRVVEAAEDESAAGEVRRVAQQARREMDASGRPWSPYRKVQEAKRRADLRGDSDQAKDSGQAQPTRRLTSSRFIERTAKQLREIIAAAATFPDLDIEGHQASADELETIAEAIDLLVRLQRRLTEVTMTAGASAVADSAGAQEDIRNAIGASQAVRTRGTQNGAAMSTTTPADATAVAGVTTGGDASFGEATCSDSGADATSTTRSRDEHELAAPQAATPDAVEVGPTIELPGLEQAAAPASEAEDLAATTAGQVPPQRTGRPSRGQCANSPRPRLWLVSMLLHRRGRGPAQGSRDRGRYRQRLGLAARGAPPLL